jgi:DNA-directed RNA polymerase specialized sigma24 family protein
MPRLRPDETERLVAGYVAGATVYELAAEFSVDRKTVSRILHRERVPMRMTGLSVEQIEEAQKLYGDGWSLVQIGERMRVDARTVHR